MTLVYYQDKHERWLEMEAKKASRASSRQEVSTPVDDCDEEQESTTNNHIDTFITAPNNHNDEEEAHVDRFVDQRYCERNDGGPCHPEYKPVNPEDLDDDDDTYNSVRQTHDAALTEELRLDLGGLIDDERPAARHRNEPDKPVNTEDLDDEDDDGDYGDDTYSNVRPIQDAALAEELRLDLGGLTDEERPTTKSRNEPDVEICIMQ
jgi:hypothetical protein